MPTLDVFIPLSGIIKDLKSVPEATLFFTLAASHTCSLKSSR